MVGDLLADPERLIAQVEESIEALKERSRRADPEAEAARTRGKISKIDKAKKNYRRQAAEELISLDELREVLSELDSERVNLTEELDQLRDSERHIEELERDRTIVLAVFAGYMTADPKLLTPDQRQDIYRRLDLTASVKPDGDIELDGRFDANFLPDPERLEYKDRRLQYRTNASVYRSRTAIESI